jgi:hypothetical protein
MTGKQFSGKLALVIALLLAFLFVAQAGFAADETYVGKPPSGSGYTVKPFSTVAIGVGVGTMGINVEVATPLSRYFNLRGDAGFANYSTSLTDSGINYNGSLAMRNGRVSLDYFPWKGGLHLTGGVMVYNQLGVAASATFGSTSNFTLNNMDYYSSTDQPLTGNASVEFGRKIAPLVGIGFGNAIPRSGRHFAFPIELGVVFTGTPTFNLNVSGVGCLSPGESSTVNVGDCFNVQDLTNAQAAIFNTNLDAQKAKVEKDLNYVKMYPILNFGVTYRF